MKDNKKQLIMLARRNTYSAQLALPWHLK